MYKYLITGGSGFIGTNLIESLLKNSSIEILNIDINSPKVEAHSCFWKKVDITNSSELEKAIVDFNPNYLIHLAARTDLRGNNLQDYAANVEGVENVLTVLTKCTALIRVVFASSMYVCRPGYNPITIDDYLPHTIYGESKVATEKIIRRFNPNNYDWVIVRPTSIWGPWFGEPYADFFNIVIHRKYFHMGKRACNKTYGYVENTVYQLEKLLYCESELVNKKMFYLGDWPAYDISEWANEIAKCIGINIPRLPYFIFQFAGKFGDLLKHFGVKFPMTSFRLKNMTTNNIQDLSPIQEISPNLPITRVEGVKKTIDWIKSNQKR